MVSLGAQLTQPPDDGSMVTLCRKSPINYIKIRVGPNKIATFVIGQFEILAKIALNIIARVKVAFELGCISGCRFPPPVEIGKKYYQSSMNLMKTPHPG